MAGGKKPEDCRVHSLGNLSPSHEIFWSRRLTIHDQLSSEDLESLLAQLRKEGVRVDEKVEEMEYGKFGRIIDPEDNRIELWEPKGQV